MRPPKNKRPLKVLVSGHLPPPMGGMATYYQSLIHSSLPEKVDLTFVQTSSHSRDFTQSGRGSISNMLLAVADIGRFTQALLRHRPQVCHIATAFGVSFLKHSICVVIARAFGSRVLLHPHCSISVLYLERSAGWKFLFRQVLRLTSGVITLSREWDQIQSDVPGCPVYFLPNAVDLALYQDVADERLSRHQKQEPFRVLYLGHIGQAKGSNDLVAAAEKVISQYESVQFELVGEELVPGERAEMANEIVSRGLSDFVKLVPPVFGPEKILLFRNADVFVYPSYHEGMPMAILEAMACALPVVATRVGGIPELVCEGENGYLAAPGDVDQLAKGILQILRNPELGAALGLRSYQMIAERFDLEKHVQQLVEIYHQSTTQK